MAAGFYLTAHTGYSYSSPSWTAFNQTNGIAALCAAPGQPDTVFLAPNLASTPVMRSIDRGASWTTVGNIFSGRNVNAPYQIYAHDASNLFFYYGEPTSVGATTNGIWRSTDAGATWTHVLSLGVQPVAGGWLAVASSKLFYVQFLSNPASTPPFNPTVEIGRLNFDGSAQETYASYTLAPSVTLNGHSLYPNWLLVRAISDDTLLACSTYGDDSAFGVEFVPAQTLSLPTTDTPIGAPQTVTPYNYTGSYITRIFAEYASSSWTGSLPTVFISFSYQDNTGAWSAVQFLVSLGNMQAGGAASLGNATIPAGARQVQMYARASQAGGTVTGLRVRETISAGFLWQITPSGIANRRPTGMLRPWDVLPLTSMRWLAVGAAADTTDVVVYCTEDAGVSWTLQTTIVAAQGFIGQSARERVHVIARSDPATADSVALLGNATTSVQQIVWQSADAGATWTLTRNAADTGPPWSVGAPGAIDSGISVALAPIVAIPGRLATIVG